MVVVDTEGQTDEGKYVELSKMLVLPHANVVVAIRGQNIFLNGLFSALQMIQSSSFDEITDGVPSALQQTMGYIKQVEHLFRCPVDAQEVVLVGYSASARQMLCLTYLPDGDGGFVESEVDDTYLSPWMPDEWERPFKATTPDHVRIISTQQIADAKVLHPDAALGGRLLLAELTREDCRFSTLDRVTDRARMAAP